MIEVSNRNGLLALSARIGSSADTRVLSPTLSAEAIRRGYGPQALAVLWACAGICPELATARTVEGDNDDAYFAAHPQRATRLRAPDSASFALAVVNRGGGVTNIPHGAELGAIDDSDDFAAVAVVAGAYHEAQHATRH